MQLLTAQKLVNSALATDPDFVASLREFHGRAVHVVPDGFGGTLRIQFAGVGIELEWFPDNPLTDPDEVAALAADPDVQLSGDVSVFLGLLRSLHDNDVTMPRGLDVRGDLGLLEELRRLMAGLAIDWEELLASKVGDVAAHQIWRGLGELRGFGENAMASVARNTSEWLRYETGMAVTRGEVDRYCADVDDVRDYLARLEARASRLQARRRAMSEVENGS